jgi:hypothetical protein
VTRPAQFPKVAGQEAPGRPAEIDCAAVRPYVIAQFVVTLGRVDLLTGDRITTASGRFTMAYQPDDDGMDERQKSEKQQAKAEREQIKKERDAQREKIRKDRAAAGQSAGS